MDLFDTRNDEAKMNASTSTKSKIDVFGSIPLLSADERESTETSQNHSRHALPTPELTTYGGIKLGWIQGVLIPCLLNIWGVMLFLRISWVVAQAGVGFSLLIIMLSTTVCVVTALSLSALCTNGQLRGGGVYYLVSRSLGAEFGASIGIIFAFANAVAASMNTIGFCDSMNSLLKAHDLKIVDNSVRDTQIIGTIALLVMCFICAFGMDWETKTQNFLIVVIVLAIANYILGASIGPKNNSEISQGYVGLNLQTFSQNWYPDFRYSEGAHHDFFSVFAMYFPAVTGVQAGANICGDLKNPETAIPKGTLGALAISTLTYILIAVMSGAGALRDASGNSTNLAQEVIASCRPNCQYGLHNNYEIVQLMSAWGPFIYAGCWAATLSTALTNLLSVPRLIQALGIDCIYPGLIFFSKPYGKHGEPYRGYVLTFFVSFIFLLIADLNKIAPLITNFYLASYAFINFCTFHAAFVRHISWRPTFKCYNKWMSLLGFLMCVIIMLVISWKMTLVTITIFMVLYLIVLYRKPDANWGSSTEAHRYNEIINNLLAMDKKTKSVKIYSPQLLVLAGAPYVRPSLLYIGGIITQDSSFMIVADVNKEKLQTGVLSTERQVGKQWLHSMNYRGFYLVLDSLELALAVRTLAQAAGVGRLTPNVLLMGYKSDWMKSSKADMDSYVRVLQEAFDKDLAVTILRVSEPTLAPPSTTSKNLSFETFSESQLQRRFLTVMTSDSNFNIVNSEDADTNDEQGFQPINQMSTAALSDNNFKVLDLHKGVLDAWLLNDDGGLNILMPYLIARRRRSGVKNKMLLRIFALAENRQQTGHAHRLMEDVLLKLRIDHNSLTMIEGIDEVPQQNSMQMFMNLVRSRSKENEISETVMSSHMIKTNRYLRLRELMLEQSAGSQLIVVTLPFPRKNVPSAIYMSWLEVLSRDLPSVYFVRGNHTSVLTLEA